MENTIDVLNWRDLIVTDADGMTCELGAYVDGGNVTEDIELDADGSIARWDGYAVATPGEDADWNTPRREVNWDGLRETLGR